MKKDFEKLILKIQSPDHGIRWEAMQSLIKSADKSTVKGLISLLNSSNPHIRNSVALVLKELRDNDAVEPLIKSIMNPDNRNNRGTLVHALQDLDCSKYFILMVELALYGNFEVQSHALMILAKNKFKSSLNEVSKAKRMIRDYINSSHKCDDWEILVDELSEYIDKIERKVKRKLEGVTVRRNGGKLS